MTEFVLMKKVFEFTHEVVQDKDFQRYAKSFGDM